MISFISNIKAKIVGCWFKWFLVSKVNSNYKKLNIKRRLDRTQRKAVEEYYKKYCGHKVPLAWHKYMYSRTGIFDIRYIPTSLYRIELIGRMNKWDRANIFSDKNLSEMLLPNIKQPKTIIKNINGYYYHDGLPISEEKAIDLCSNLADVIIKPSLLEGGKGVRSLSVVNGVTDFESKTIKVVFSNYKKDFLIQEKIVQHKEMERLNPSSVNTIRVLTYRIGMDILLLYAVVRIGKAGMVVDNESQGGISAKINRDGTIAKFAYGAPGNEKVEFTDSGVVLEGYKIPYYKKVIEAAKQCHYQLPDFNIVGWDFCVDQDGNPVLIEWNSNPDLSQTANGPAFGEYTDLILSDIYNHLNTRNGYW